MGCISGSFTGKGLELGCCQILAFYQRESHPQLIGSTRHVSMDAVSVLEEAWEGHCLRLALQCIPGTEETYTVALPEGYAEPELQCVGAEGSMAQEGKILSLSVKGKEERAEIKISLCKK